MMMNIQAIRDLNALGYSVLFLQDYDQYYVISEANWYNPSEHIYDNEITGKNISLLVSPIGSKFTDEYTIRTIIEKEKESCLRFPTGIKYLFFSLHV